MQLPPSEDPLLQDLTPEQQLAVTTTDGPLLILAGAGSGKTRVLTRRVAHLIRLGVDPASILAITFTNKAAGEMKHRVGQIMGRPIKDFGQLPTRFPLLCTFHSLCLRILKHYAADFGLNPSFAVFDSGDQTRLMKEALKAADVSATNFPPAQVAAHISKAKNRLMLPADFVRSASDFISKNVARVYPKYQDLLTSNNALDFDDLLLQTACGFRNNPQVLAALQDRFNYILIDEYQDTNHAQYVIAHALALKRRNICVVGDPDQSIYAWRGADLQNILDFENDYPDATIVKLEHNYRSTKRILAIADALIANNTRRKEKKLLTTNPDGDLIRVVAAQDEHDEAAVVTAELKHHHAAGIPWSGMAVFYRMNALSRVMEDALRRAGIPYVMARGVEFYNRKEIKDTLSYLRVIANPADEVSLERIINTPPRGIGESTLKLLQTHAMSTGTPVFDLLRRAATVEGVSSRAAKSIASFVQTIDTLRALLTSHTPASPAYNPDTDPANDPMAQYAPIQDDLAPIPDDADIFSFNTPPPPAPSPEALLQQSPPSQQSTPTHQQTTLAFSLRHFLEQVIRRSGLEAVYAKDRAANPTAETDALSNVEELINSAAEFDDAAAEAAEAANSPELQSPQTQTPFPPLSPLSLLDAYLSQVSLVADADHIKGEAGGAVTLMTLHAAKGLEFPVVAMIGMEEGVLPHSRARNSLEEMEEERRLCFVGITRARQHLLLTKALYRTIRGLRERTVTSPFISELPKDHLQLIDRSSHAYDNEDDQSDSQLLADSPDASQDHRLPPRATAAPFRSPASSRTNLRIGQKVRHASFGLGTVQDVTLIAGATRVVVDFTITGRKTLIAEFAKLQVVS